MKPIQRIGYHPSKNVFPLPLPFLIFFHWPLKYSKMTSKVVYGVGMRLKNKTNKKVQDGELEKKLTNLYSNRFSIENRLHLGREGMYLMLTKQRLEERRFNTGIYPLAPFHDDTSRIKARAFVLSNPVNNNFIFFDQNKHSSCLWSVVINFQKILTRIGEKGHK